MQSKFKKVKSKIFIFCFLSILFLSGFTSLIFHNNEGDLIPSAQPRGGAADFPIIIIGDFGWIDFQLAGNCSGSGTALDPYVIEDKVIEGGGSTPGIYVVNSSVVFVIENCSVDRVDPTWMGGIVLNNVTNGMIRNSTFTNCPAGLLLTNCTACIIDNNTLQANEYGISFLNNVYQSMVRFNVATGNNVGIEIQGNCTDNIVMKNDISQNIIDGLRLLMNCSRNNITENTITNNVYKGLYFSQGVINSFVINNTMTGNGNNGIWLNYWSTDNVINRNNISKNGGDGLRLENVASNNSILINEIHDNTRHGIALESGACNNTIYHNYVVDNGNYGANVSTGCDGNLIYGNNFTANVMSNAGDDGRWNLWDNGSVGNFWGDYAGVDDNDDGIGDVPQDVPGSDGVQDNYPLWEDEDILPPTITICAPISNEKFGLTAPYLNVSIVDLHFDQAWYIIGTNLTSFFISSDFVGLIDSVAWEGQDEGAITIQVFANDTLSHQDSESVIVFKDSINPIVIINRPANWAFLGSTTPNYNVTITEENLDSAWLVIILSNGTMWNYTLPNFVGTIPQEIWDQVPMGTHRIRVYADDTAGNEAYDEVTIIKTTGQILGYPMEFLVGVVLISVAIIFSSRRWRRKFRLN